jgi:hypothetical protein
VPVRPSKLWKDLPLETRVAAADAFWREDEAGEQQAEAIVTLARRLNFRTKSVQGLPVERRARHLAQLPDVSDAIAGRALVAYHFARERPLMAAFLDALGIAHENGLITSEEVPPPAPAALAAAVEKTRGAFPREAVDLYLRTLLVLDGDTWSELDHLLPPTD